MSAPLDYKIEHLEDFTKHAWCNALLSDPSITRIMKRSMPPPQSGPVSNTFFTQTLFTEDAIRAFLSMYRPSHGRAQSLEDAAIASDALLGANSSSNTTSPTSSSKEIDPTSSPDGPEAMILVSLGSGIDGGIQRLHGGVTATLLDHVMGMLVSYSHRNGCATAELSIKYKKPIMTPTVLLCKSRIVREAGRWIELVGWVEDGMGTVFAEGRGAFVKNRPGNGNGRGMGFGVEKKAEAKTEAKTEAKAKAKI